MEHFDSRFQFNDLRPIFAAVELEQAANLVVPIADCVIVSGPAVAVPKVRIDTLVKKFFYQIEIAIGSRYHQASFVVIYFVVQVVADQECQNLMNVC